MRDMSGKHNMAVQSHDFNKAFRLNQIIPCSSHQDFDLTILRQDRGQTVQ